MNEQINTTAFHRVLDGLRERRIENQKRLSEKIDNTPPSSCKNCGTKRPVNRELSLYRGEIMFESCAPCAKEKRERELLRNGIPANLIEAEFGNWKTATDEQRKNLEIVQTFATEAECGFLFLLGGFGIGKTHLAVAAAKECGDFHFVTHGQLLRNLRKTYSDDEAEDPIARCKDVSLLVLDELGLSAGGKDEFPMLHEILCHRYNQKLRTIITSNLELGGVRSLIGERVADRLEECCYAVLTFTGESHRAAARNKYFQTKHAD